MIVSSYALNFEIPELPEPLTYLIHQYAFTPYVFPFDRVKIRAIPIPTTEERVIEIQRQTALFFFTPNRKLITAEGGPGRLIYFAMTQGLYVKTALRILRMDKDLFTTLHFSWTLQGLLASDDYRVVHFNPRNFRKTVLATSDPPIQFFGVWRSTLFYCTLQHLHLNGPHPWQTPLKPGACFYFAEDLLFVGNKVYDLSSETPCAPFFTLPGPTITAMHSSKSALVTAHVGGQIALWWLDGRKIVPMGEAIIEERGLNIHAVILQNGKLYIQAQQNRSFVFQFS